MNQTRRFAWFDCLRCAAVMFVLLAHCGDMAKSFPPFFARAFIDGQAISWFGVDLFFVLSGFLVSGLLFDEHDSRGKIDLGRFLIRRGFKIVPPFYFLVLVTAVVDLLLHLKHQPLALLSDLAFLQSYTPGNWPHAWTLSLEVYFYLLLGLLLYFLARRPPARGPWLKNLPLILTCVLVGEFLVRLVHSTLRYLRPDHNGFKFQHDLEPFHLHLDVLAGGVLLRYLYNYWPAALAFLRHGKVLWIILGLLLVWPSQVVSWPHPPVVTALIPTCNLLGFGLIVFQATQIPFPVNGPARWLVKPFDYLGKHSYSIYLWHLPMSKVRAAGGSAMTSATSPTSRIRLPAMR
jgi:peptidoglycan/LPS O-acetylase OafA/YrhL